MKCTKDILPPPTWSLDELIPPEEINSELSLEFWQRARDVTLWSALPLHRHRLFQPGSKGTAFLSDFPPILTHPLALLRGLVEAPDKVEQSEIAAACAQICKWAEEAGHLRLARMYAEAWANVEPISAQAAATAGGLSTRLADYARAEIWLQRAVRLGRATRTWEWYIRGYLRRGILQFNLGNYKPARRYYSRAYRTAMWGGFTALAGKARHDMMTICTDVGAFDLGIDYGCEVLQLYPADDPVFPYFVHDFAFLLTQAGHFTLSDRLLCAALEFIPDHRRLLILGTLARTAAAMGDKARYERLSSEVIRRSGSTHEGAAAAYVRLADGARQFADWDRAERLAGIALDIAHKRYEGQPQRLAHELLDKVSVRDSSVKQAELRRNVASLVPAFLARLRKHSAPVELAGALTKVP